MGDGTLRPHCFENFQPQLEISSSSELFNCSEVSWFETSCRTQRSRAQFEIRFQNYKFRMCFPMNSITSLEVLASDPLQCEPMSHVQEWYCARLQDADAGQQTVRAMQRTSTSWCQELKLPDDFLSGVSLSC